MTSNYGSLVCRLGSEDRIIDGNAVRETEQKVRSLLVGPMPREETTKRHTKICYLP
jgi:hypothetical protein